MSHRCVIAGASLGGYRTARELRRLGYEGEILLIGEENHPPYQRPPLSKQLLTGKFTEQRCFLRGEVSAPYRLITGVRVTGANLGENSIVTSDGHIFNYDHLVIATGSSPRRLPGVEPQDRVLYLRTLDDSVSIRDMAERSHNIAMVGAGFIGGEIASSLRTLDKQVTLYDNSPFPMSSVIGNVASQILLEHHRTHGVTLHLGRSISRIETEDDSVRVKAGNDSSEYEFIVVGVGSLPNTRWAPELPTDDSGAILTDEFGKVVGEENVYALGDASSWYHPLYKKALHFEHFETAIEQAKTVANTITNGASEPLLSLPFAWSEQHGYLIQTLGIYQSDSEEIVLHQNESEIVVGFKDEGRLTGAITINSSTSIEEVSKRIIDSLGEP